MNENFITIKGLEGDLKISHKKRDFGLTVSTREMVFQKPHANYYIKLEDIISITPFEQPAASRSISFNNRREAGSEMVNLHAGMLHYRIYVSKSELHNRSGIFRLEKAQFILPIKKDLLLAISKYGGLNAFT
ncbi:hypothetical protein PAESOLCIP111_02324 [Paenibacillus solanacearum]|uniref:Uncharacterized protein n=1 Tax=Paenibacillus solanacearum TaxID=2048548 RepID=A0A916NWZ5_9BACL|nr:hypothetical protein [Paenibacillus solanacearum]CAG7621184.1 hypothetical protein PAESOLCIP111_02324 [Paenibacillus solanacearum]